jgi:hypothetical protein
VVEPEVEFALNVAVIMVAPLARPVAVEPAMEAIVVLDDVHVTNPVRSSVVVSGLFPVAMN